MEKKNPEQHALLGLVGAGALKGALGDYPKGVLEDFTRQGVEAKFAKKPAIKSLLSKKFLGKAFSGTGIGRAAGGVAAGSLTFPLFYSGMQDLRSKEKDRQAKGIAKVVGSGVLYQGGKGGIEYGWKALRQPKPGTEKLLSSAQKTLTGLGGKSFVARGAAGRAFIGLGTSVATAYGLSRALPAGEGKKKKSILPAALALGGVIGAGKGMVDAAALGRQGKWWNPKAYAAVFKLPKATWVPGVAARAAGGAAGTAVLGALLSHLMKPKKTKTASRVKLAGMLSTFTPYPHQQKAIDRFLENGQLILAHGTGSGKSATSIAAFEEARKRGQATKALVVVPSGLKNNFALSGVAKFTDSPYQIVGSKTEQGQPNTVYLDTIGDVPYTIVSYDMFSRDPVGLMQRTGADTLVLDEFHRIRNERAKVHRAALAARQYAKNFMGLTASPINNSPAEIATLVNVATNGQYLKRQQFSNRYLRTTKVQKGFFGGKKKVKELRRQAEVAQYIRPIVDYRSDGELKHLFPKKNVNVVDVPMSDEQQKRYDYVMGQLGPIQKMITGREVDISDRDMAHVFSRVINARRVLNDVSAIGGIAKAEAPERTPKVHKVLNDVQQHLAQAPDAKAVVYSNLIRGGLDTVALGLRQRGIPFGSFIGMGRALGDQVTSHATRNQAVQDYKAGKLKVLLVSGAGAEGLDLKNTTGFFSLDGHWNPERIRQAEARAVRLKGQESRPPEQRQVEVNRYRTVYPQKKWYQPGVAAPTVDEWVYDVAARKHTLNTQLRHVLKVEAPKGFAPHKYQHKYRSPKTGEWVYVYPKEKTAEKGEAHAAHKYIGPTLASIGTGSVMGAALSKGARGRGALAGGLAGGVNALLWKALTRGYAKAVDVPYKDVVA